MRALSLLSITAVVLAAGPATAAETIDNPEFAMWSKYKKGTSITLKTTSNADGVKSETTMTTTLLEAGAGKIVVATSAVSTFDGMEFKTPPTNRDVAKTIELPEGLKKEDFTGAKPKGTYEEGTETLKVGGTEYKAKWYKYKIEIGGGNTDAKMWTCDEVPGSMLKLEMTTTAAGKTGTSTTELVEFKKP